MEESGQQRTSAGCCGPRGGAAPHPHDGAVGKEDFLDGGQYWIVKHCLFFPYFNQLWD